MKLLRSVDEYPELARFDNKQRRRIVAKMNERFRLSRGNRIFEASVSVALCAAVAAGLTVGYFHGGPWSAFGVMVVFVFATTLAFAFIAQSMWRRRVREFLNSEGCRALIETFGL